MSVANLAALFLAILSGYGGQAQEQDPREPSVEYLGTVSKEAFLIKKRIQDTHGLDKQAKAFVKLHSEQKSHSERVMMSPVLEAAWTLGGDNRHYAESTFRWLAETSESSLAAFHFYLKLALCKGYVRYSPPRTTLDLELLDDAGKPNWISIWDATQQIRSTGEFGERIWLAQEFLAELDESFDARQMLAFALKYPEVKLPALHRQFFDEVARVCLLRRYPVDFMEIRALEDARRRRYYKECGRLCANTNRWD
ncbi:MAG: hypothetical protein H0W86_07265 [Armatimonadetes bacterium]|nr:hypothetical protein [Armatimonadota bacterium]